MAGRGGPADDGPDQIEPPLLENRQRGQVPQARAIHRRFIADSSACASIPGEEIDVGRRMVIVERGDSIRKQTVH